MGVERDEGMRKAEYKRHDELAAWDLNKGSRHFVNSSTRGNRALKKVLRRQSRKKFGKVLDNYSRL